MRHLPVVASLFLASLPLAALANPAPAPALRAQEDMALVEQLAPFGRQPFLEDRSRILRSLPRDGNAPTAALRLGHLYLAHGFWREAGSIAEAALAMTPPEAQARAALRLRFVAGLLDPLPAPGTQDPVPDAFSDSREAAFWTRIHALSAGRTLEDDLPAGVSLAIIETFPTPMRAALLPLLAQEAIDASNWDLLRRIGAALQAIPGMAGSPVDLFLQGRAVEAAGSPLDAIALYAKASESRSPWAQRARLRRLKLLEAIERPDDPGAFLREIEAARRQWRGGPEAMEILEMSLRAHRNSGDAVGALMALEDIRTYYPHAATRVAPDSLRWEIVAEFYRSGASGGLDAEITGHRRLKDLYGHEPEFLPHLEAMADRLMALGLTAMAAEDFGVLGVDLRALRQSQPERVAGGDIDRARLKQVQALLAGGRGEEAWAQLAEPFFDSASHPERDRLRAQAAEMRGQPDLVPPVRPGAMALRLENARAAFARGQWRAARGHYLDWMEARQGRFEPEDIARLALASWREDRLSEDRSAIEAAGELAGYDRLPATLDALLGGEDLPLGLERLTREIEAVERATALLGGSASGDYR